VLQSDEDIDVMAGIKGDAVRITSMCFVTGSWKRIALVCSTLSLANKDLCHSVENHQGDFQP
jgi:hypothetical protein